MQRGLRVINLHGAIDKSPILLSQYWKEWLDGTIIISYFDGSNNIFLCRSIGFPEGYSKENKHQCKKIKQ